MGSILDYKGTRLWGKNELVRTSRDFFRKSAAMGDGCSGWKITETSSTRRVLLLKMV